MKITISFFVVWLTWSNLAAEQIGTVGYVQFDSTHEDDVILNLNSGGADEIAEFVEDSNFLSCRSYKEVIASEEITRNVCLMRLTKEGFSTSTDLVPEAPTAVILDEVLSGQDRRFDFSFAAGIDHKNSNQLIVWLRGASAEALYEAVVKLNSIADPNGLFQGKNLSCYKRSTSIQTRSGISPYRPYMQWCKFIVTKKGEIEAYPIPQWILEEMKNHAGETK